MGDDQGLKMENEAHRMGAFGVAMEKRARDEGEGLKEERVNRALRTQKVRSWNVLKIHVW